MRLLSNLFLIFSPDDNPGIAPGKEAAIEYIMKDDEPEVIDIDKKKDPKDTKVKDDEGKDEDEEIEDEEKEDDEDLKELEEDLKDDEEPADDELEDHQVVNKKEVLKKFPTLFKDFPGLEKAYYRDQQFSNVFANPADAKQAVESVEILQELEKDLQSGNSEKLLSISKSEDPAGFAKLVDNFLPTLAKVDKEAYANVISYVLKHTITAMVAEGKSQKIEALEVAAQIVNKYIFGKGDFEPHVSLTDALPKDEAGDKVREKENEFLAQQFNNHRENINGNIDRSLKATIEKHLDPKDMMTPYIKNVAAKQAYESVVKLISHDTRFSKNLDKLWERAVNSNFANKDLDSIKKAFQSRAAVLLPSVIKKARVDGLRGMGKRTNEKVESEDDSDLEPNRVGAPATHKKQVSGSKHTSKGSGKIPTGMTTLEYLMDDNLK